MTHKGFVKYANEIKDPAERIESIKRWQKMRFTASIGMTGKRLKMEHERGLEYSRMIEAAEAELAAQ